jgi:hypothetical protein
MSVWARAIVHMAWVPTIRNILVILASSMEPSYISQVGRLLTRMLQQTRGTCEQDSLIKQGCRWYMGLRGIDMTIVSQELTLLKAESNVSSFGRCETGFAFMTNDSSTQAEPSQELTTLSPK